MMRDISGCGLIGFINRDGKLTSGGEIIRAIFNMRERGNGLGAGFAGYGIYPDYADCFALHVMCDNDDAVSETTRIVHDVFIVRDEGEIPTRPISEIMNPPILVRYFVRVRPELLNSTDDGESNQTEEDIVVRTVMQINENVKGAYVFSSGRNMGAFKAVGEPDAVARFYRLEDYQGYAWIAHTRFPTNTPGWWGGAHPFTILDWAIVHNGEISSYGINKRYLEMWGYKCTLLTDTEVVAYALDLLIRKHRLPIRTAFMALTSPFWKEIDHPQEAGLPADMAELVRFIRMVYGPTMLNGPFAIIFGFTGGIAGFNDRIKLRPFVAGEKDETVFMASEAAAIRVLCPDADRVWMPRAGEPLIACLTDEAKQRLIDQQRAAEECARINGQLYVGNPVKLESSASQNINSSAVNNTMVAPVQRRISVSTSRVVTATQRGAGALGSVPTSWERPKPIAIGDGEYEIDAKGIYYRFLNDEIRKLARRGAKRIVLRNVQGQRYIGTGVRTSVRIEIYGTAGNDLAAFMDGATIEVYGDAQDGVGNTMNEGTVIVHGNAGDVIGYGMRGGRVYIYGDVGYRVGIHMKAYQDKVPVIVVGGTAGDFLGEYMAGGMLIVLGMTGRSGRPLTGDYVGTGMHGGVIYLRGEPNPFKWGKEVGVGEISRTEWECIVAEVKQFAECFNLDADALLNAPFVKLYPKSHRPYGHLYTYWWAVTPA